MKEIQRLNKKGFSGEREAWRLARELQKQHNDKHIGHSPNKDGTFCVAEYPIPDTSVKGACEYLIGIDSEGILKKMKAILKRINKLDLNKADNAMLEEADRINDLLNTAYYDTDYFNSY